ncbi:hypothetical protein OS493_039102 [Desmophyllum pertusum]|uniref:Uncharacterized protein n=1 Tax=Desmophyllum pertusum TaxID=174260 RepID=A0A9X0D7Z7_9CNID|nr:hypothetical protein OS493_039102 [Desmophyllum pertusum]
MRERRRRCCWIYRKLILAVALDGTDQRLPALACHESIIEERKSKGPDVHHLEQVKSMQSTFQRQAEFYHIGNPFKETSQKSDLVKIPEKLPASPIEATLVVGPLLVDGTALVNTLKPDQCVKM